jgi:hypothetical protein
VNPFHLRCDRDLLLCVATILAVALYLVHPLLQPGYFLGHEGLAPLQRAYGFHSAYEDG